MVGLQTLDLAILVRVQVSQPKFLSQKMHEVVDLWWKLIALTRFRGWPWYERCLSLTEGWADARFGLHAAQTEEFF